MGKSHGFAGYLAFSKEKGVIKQRLGMTIPKFIYPPYNGFKRWVVNFIIKYF